MKFAQKIKPCKGLRAFGVSKIRVIVCHSSSPPNSRYPSEFIIYLRYSIRLCGIIHLFLHLCI